MNRCSIKSLWLIIFLFWGAFQAFSQRIYAPNSVLASGSWYKIAVKEAGVYKIDLALLTRLGINASGTPSSSIQLYGTGGAMLPEAANGAKTDDLQEIPIWAEDGGDGQLNGSDYFLFYAPGPHPWIADTVNKTFRHQKNLYSDRAYYYIRVGSNGKRIQTQSAPPAFNNTVNSYHFRYYYEKDSFNFLSSGREWYGEEFSSLPGRSLTHNFIVPWPAALNGTGEIRSELLARTFGTGARFSIRWNGQLLAQNDIPAVTNNALDIFARTAAVTVPITTASASNTLQLDMQSDGLGGQGWLNWFEIHGRASLDLSAQKQVSFRDWNSVAPGRVNQYQLTGVNAGAQVWQVSNPLLPLRMSGTVSNGSLQFNANASDLEEYIAINSTDLPVPEAIGTVPNQNLHNSRTVDYIIITTETLLTEAERLAAYHRVKDTLRTIVVPVSSIYNEFSGGSPDPTALRDFVKMYFDKAGADSSLRPRYLCLFGDASFDYKDRLNNNTNLVPSFQSISSLDPLTTYTSDDYFGFLNDADNINGNGINLLDIGIGRIPASTEAQAKAIVDKILGYHSPAALGPWRNELSFVADDEDGNLHLSDAEVVTNTAIGTAPVFNIDKIYLDAYPQEGGAGGSRYPEANRIINARFFNGTLIWNYSGHGGFRRLAEEVILDQDIINSINNPERLPLFITATCDVAPYDNPLIRSIGEDLLLRPRTGAIALMTTTRLVFAFSNRVMNDNYLKVALKKETNGLYPSLGEAVRGAKNLTYSFFGDPVNNRKFTLLGDPALRLAFPEHEVVTTSINGQVVGAIPDTLKALSTYRMAGEIRNRSGALVSDFNGTVYPVIYDKAQSRNTLGNDPGSVVVPFTEQRNIIYKGRAKVINGRFQFEFVVPLDIDYRLGNGRLSYYGENGLSDGNGVMTNLLVGGTGTGTDDKEGPGIKAWLNDEKFVDGGITNAAPILLMELRDSSGINIMGTGIGHDLEAILDDDTRNPIRLNEFYASEIDNYKKGRVRFQLPALTEGLHTLRLRAWDVANNASEKLLSFRVVKKDQFTLEHVLNYPNPFTTHTRFWFEHNRPGESLRVTVQIYTVSGKLVKTLRETIISTGNRSTEVSWDGRDDYGSKLGRGVYIYRLRVETEDRKAADKWEKLFLL